MLTLQFTANPDAVAGSYVLDVIQYMLDAHGRQIDVGGVRYTVEIAP